VRQLYQLPLTAIHAVMAGLGPAIHVFHCYEPQRRGWPAFAGHDGESHSVGTGISATRTIEGRGWFGRIGTGYADAGEKTSGSGAEPCPDTFRLP
jgi:hypothetical protein